MLYRRKIIIVRDGVKVGRSRARDRRFALPHTLHLARACDIVSSLALVQLRFFEHPFYTRRSYSPFAKTHTGLYTRSPLPPLEYPETEPRPFCAAGIDAWKCECHSICNCKTG